MFFADNMLQITQTANSIWTVLKSVGSLLSIGMLIRIIAGMRHGNRFHKSFFKSYIKQKKRFGEPAFTEQELKDMADKEEGKYIRKRQQKEFTHTFSFDRYMEMQMRVERLEQACERNNILERSNSIKYSDHSNIEKKYLLDESETESSSSSEDDVEAYLRSEEQEMEKQLHPEPTLKMTLMSKYSKVYKTNDQVMNNPASFMMVNNSEEIRLTEWDGKKTYYK